MSPANAEYDGVRGLSFLFGKLHRDDMKSLLYRPVDVREIHLEPFLQRHPDVRFAADAQVNCLAFELVEAFCQGIGVHRLLVTDRVETFIGLIRWCHFLPPPNYFPIIYNYDDIFASPSRAGYFTAMTYREQWS